MLIIITIGILLGAHLYIHVVELIEAEARGNTILVPTTQEQGITQRKTPSALVPT